MRGSTLAVAIIVAGSAMASAAEKAPSLTGRWSLVRSSSDDVQAKIEAAAGSDKTTGEGGQGYEGHSGLGILPRGSAAEKDLVRVELRQALLDAIPSLDVIEIVDAPDELKYVDADDNVRIFYFGREHTRQTRVGTKVQCRARREKQQVVVEEQGEKVKLTETLVVAPDGLLIHWLLLESKLLQAPINMKLVYEPRPASEPGP